MSAAVPKLFDLGTLALRRERARRMREGRGDLGDFLLDFAIQDILDRLDFIKRQFRRALILGETTETLEAALRGRIGSEGTITVLDPTGFIASGDGVGVLADRMAATSSDFDLVVSPLALHLVDDLPGVMTLVRQTMTSDGLMIANIIGGQTLQELRISLIEAEDRITGGAAARVHPMIDVRSFGALLQRAGFALPVADSDVLDVSYATSLDLMMDLRATGRTSLLAERSQRSLTRTILTETEAHYRANFPADKNRLRATYEIVTGTGWAPHESQQKPLKPGSATGRLADALRSRQTGEPKV